MEAAASERSVLSWILRICVALSNSQRICLARVYEDERFISISFVGKLVQRLRIRGYIESGRSREGYLDRARLSGWR
jgi:hypothetical protein